MIFKVGLTGGIASGKSTIASRLRENGIPVLDADQIVHDLYRPGAAGTRAATEAFGREILGPDGGIDRSRLSKKVFGDPGALARLNALVHPLVFEAQSRWFEELEKKGTPLGVIEATLLVETGGRNRYNVLIAVSAPEDTRLARALNRSGETAIEDLRRRIAAQIPDSEREKAADIVIRTDGTKEELLKKVDELAARLKTEARRRAAK
jgi:dephospho-CoA kinase